MLQTIDVLIGFSLVMLVLSVVVTMLVQFVVSTLLNLKGRVLKEGVAHLLNLLDKDGLTATETQQIAGHLLSNTLVARKRVFGSFFGRKFDLAHAIHREELIKLVLDFAGNLDLEKASELTKKTNTQVRLSELNETELAGELTGEQESELARLRDPISEAGLEGHQLLQTRLLNSLRRNGVAGDPKDIIKAIRAEMLVLEQEQPELASDVRQTMAIAKHASSEFVAKINAWFDQTIDRTVESFTGKTRAWTTLFAAVVALFFQVDTFDLLQRLSVDKEARQMMVDAATNQPQQFRALATMQLREAKDAAQTGVDTAQKQVAEATDEADKEKAQDELAAAQSRLDKASEALANLDTPGGVDKQAQADLDAAQKRFDAAKTEPARAEAQKALTDARKRSEEAKVAQFTQRDALKTIQDDPGLGKLIDAELISKPESFEAWQNQWPNTFFAWLARIVGILVTIGLLTLGAPVWYEILKNLIQFRSLVARKDDVERKTRQTSQKPAG